MSGKIRHLAIRVEDPDKMAAFYEKAFGMKFVRKSPSGSIFITDGYINVALLKNKGDGARNGLDHFGFLVDDMDQIGENLVAAGASAPVVRPNDPPYAETRSTDPEGNMFDLSVHGYEEAEFQADRKDKVAEKV